MSCIIEIKKNAMDQIFFIFKIESEVIAVSGSYLTRAELERHVVMLRDYLPFLNLNENNAGSILTVDISEIDLACFTIKHLKGETILRSKHYRDREACIRDYQKMKEGIVSAKMTDQTEVKL
ncbi:MAG: hypothetical protein JXR88_18770 [Clostridia bacterium]|nr:hypothetical protein [Clostridia bacterium]